MRALPAALVILPGLALGLCGCDLSMARQARPFPQASAQLWEEGPTIQPPPPGTVVFGHVAAMAEARPPVSLALVERGRDRFDIYCLPCHGELGHADGQVVRRGFPSPPDFDEPRLRAAPVSHFYDVATNGYGVMFGYGQRLSSDDRWAVAAYVRALQLAGPAARAPAPPEGPTIP